VRGLRRNDRASTATPQHGACSLPVSWVATGCACVRAMVAAVTVAAVTAAVETVAVEKVGVEMETVEEAKSVFLLNSFCFILLSKLRSFISLL
jgi:hypothetical protein